MRDSFDAALTSDFVEFSHCVTGELLLGLSCEFGDAFRAGVTTLALVVDDEVVVVALDLGEFPETPFPKTIVEITEVVWFVSRARASVLVSFDHITVTPHYRSKCTDCVENSARSFAVLNYAPRQIAHRVHLPDRGVVVYGRKKTSGMIARVVRSSSAVLVLGYQFHVLSVSVCIRERWWAVDTNYTIPQCVAVALTRIVGGWVGAINCRYNHVRYQK